jgi:hypothetical protein
MGTRRTTRRAAWLATTLVAGSLGAAFAAQPVAAADVTVTIGPGPDYVLSEPNLTVTIGDVVTYQNLGDGSGKSSDIHIIAHLPAHWVDIVVYSTTSAPTPIRPEPSKFVWETGPWALEGKGYPPYGTTVSFPPITEPTTLVLSCLVHGTYEGPVYTSQINQTVNLIPAPAETTSPDPSDPTTDPSASTDATQEATGEVLPIATDLTTLPPTDALAIEDRAATNVAAVIAALIALLVPAIVASVLRPARPRRRLE